MRAAALAALGELGCGGADFATVERALQAPAWQVRLGAARALAGAAAGFAVSAVSRGPALSDPHLDVRKAAVLSLARWAGDPAARDALGTAFKDSDADVRAYARRALATKGRFEASEWRPRQRNALAYSRLSRGSGPRLG